MIFGYILATIHGLLIHSNFFEIKPTKNLDLVTSAISAIHTFTTEVLGEPVDKILTDGNQIVVAYKGNVMLAIISKANVAMAKQLAKKFVKIFAEKLKTEDLTILSDSISKKVEKEIKLLESEIKQINKKFMQISYI